MFCVIIITIIIVENSKLTKTRYLERPIKMAGYVTNYENEFNRIYSVKD